MKIEFARRAAAQRIQELTRPTGQESALDIDFPAPRVEIGVRQAGLITAAVLLAIVGWVILAHARAPALSPVQPVQLPAAPSLEASTASPVELVAQESPAPLVVSVVGAVEHPGLHTLAPGARVAEALELAKVRPEAELLGLNLAEKLQDGRQILVPEPGQENAQSIIAGADPGTGAVSLNSATAEQLQTLSGVGAKTAAAIIAHREAIGGFSSVEQLMDVKGIGAAKFAALQGEVSL